MPWLVYATGGALTLTTGLLWGWPGALLLAAGVTLLVFATTRKEGRRRERLEKHNRELLSLQEAALDIYSELDLDKVLQRIVDQARHLLKARYGAVSVVDEGGRIQVFLTSGIDLEARKAIGEPPRGRGLLGVVLQQGEHLRLDQLHRDPRSVGFPDNHPPMRSLLAVPVPAKAPFRGNLYLADKIATGGFSENDQGVLESFARKAAIAIDHAHLHRRLSSLAVAEERVRIAREMHDGMAQILAYVNTKAQAVSHLLDRERVADAEVQLEQLSGAVRGVYADVREGIAALRVPMGSSESLGSVLADYAGTWRDQSGIDLKLRLAPRPEGVSKLGSTVELQVLRVVQEALANIRKHSGARRARLILEHSDDSVVITVEDEGRGFDLSATRRPDLHHGLAIMHERADSIGADLEVDTAPGNGCRICLQIPRGVTMSAEA